MQVGVLRFWIAVSTQRKRTLNLDCGISIQLDGGIPIQLDGGLLIHLNSKFEATALNMGWLQ